MERVLGVDVQQTVAKDPVMDVPAIDMTDAVVTSQKPPALARTKSARRAASGRKQRPTAKAKGKTRSNAPATVRSGGPR